MLEEHSAPFYGKTIICRSEQEYIKSILKKYQKKQVTEELKKLIWDELQNEKHLGNITIPFKLAVRKDPYGNFPNYIEVILDTKV